MTPKQQMTDWLSRHHACREGREWAEKECASLDDVWAKAKPDWLIWVAARALDKRNRVAFGAACAERVLYFMRAWQAAYLRANFKPDWNL